METLVRPTGVEFNDNEKNTTGNQNDNVTERSTLNEETLTTTNTVENIDILVIKRDHQTNRKLLNKTAYAKLQRSLSPTRNGQLSSLKEKYEQVDKEVEVTKSDYEKSAPSEAKLTEPNLEPIRRKSKLPVPKPRETIKSEIISPSQKITEKFKYRHSLMLDKKTKKKDENSNEVFRKSSSSSGEFITVVTRSESIETVDQFEKELDLFTMDKKVKDKKRANSFRRIFTGKIFTKEKKKKDETESILQQKRNVHSDNLQNERQAPHRNSLRNTNTPKPILHETVQRRIPPPNINMQEIEKRYAEMRVKDFNNIKHNFDKQSSFDEIDKIPTVTPGPMDYNKVANINKFIDTSSSASAESDKDNSSRNMTDQENPFKFTKFVDNQRDTPPRAQELMQNRDVRLVNPKALIPITSERPLPNPYHNTISSTKPVISPKPQITTNSLSTRQKFDYNTEKKLNTDKLPVLNETYGTVLDNIEKKNDVWMKKDQKPPRSPSLEPSKLRLPSNRDIGSMSPRMRSPIPQHHVSTEKLIATELLRTSRSPTPTKKKPNQLSSSHQRLDLNADFSDNVRNEPPRAALSVTTKPPISRTSDQKNQLSPIQQTKIQDKTLPSYEDLQRNRQLPPNYDTRIQNIPLDYENGIHQSPRSSHTTSLQRSGQLPPNRNYHSSPIQSSQERLIGNQIINPIMTSPTPNNTLQNTELSPLRIPSSRSSTPVELRIPTSTNTPSPQKEEMRRSVEAYYWKEIKKLKEQENLDLYYYQMQMMPPFGYVEGPINYRRSRSTSPSSQRNGRRSLSLPREPKPQIEANDNYGRFQPAPIPEGRAVVNYYPNNIYNEQYFRRNAPERRTIDSLPRTNENTIYRPIFKRGSLTTPVRELVVEDQQQKKVSFNRDGWPTRNGYAQSPPQRRVDTTIRHESLDDDVFLPSPQQTSKLIVDGKEIYGSLGKPPRQQDTPYQNANFYKQIHQEPIYSPRSSHKIENASRIPRGITRYNSIQLVDAQEQPHHQRVSRRMSYDNSQDYVSRPQNVVYNLPRRQIYLKDDIYGYFGGYVVNEQQQPVGSESTYGYERTLPKQVTIRDKVCDMYGQIHDRDSPALSVRKSGVILGQLQQAQMVPNQNFVRNSRLTASANDMNRRYQNIDPAIYYSDTGRPSSTRPLPPVPGDKRLFYAQNAVGIQHFSDQQNNNNSLGKSKKRGMFGK